MNNKPLLFLCSSSAVKLDDLYYLKDIGKVLNFADAPIDLVQKYMDRDFIICDLKDPKQVDLLKYVNPDNVISIGVLRKYESVAEEWIQRIQPQFKVKDFKFVKNCKTKDEVLNTCKFKNSFKQPDSDCMFYFKKLSFLVSCCQRGGD